MTGYAAIGTTPYDYAICAAMAAALTGAWLYGQRHAITAHWRHAAQRRRTRRDLHRAAMVRAAQRAAADRLGAGTWGTPR